MIREYVKRPVIVKAVQWTGDNEQEVFDFVGRKNLYLKGTSPRELPKLWIKTLEGDHLANIGDYIIKGIKGEFYPCKEDVFLETYKTSKCEIQIGCCNLSGNETFELSFAKGYTTIGFSSYQENKSSFRYMTMMNRMVHWWDYKRYKCKHCLEYESDIDECYKRKMHITKNGNASACKHFVMNNDEEEKLFNIHAAWNKMLNLDNPTRWSIRIGNMMFKKSIDELLREKQR